MRGISHARYRYSTAVLYAIPQTPPPNTFEWGEEKQGDVKVIAIGTKKERVSNRHKEFSWNSGQNSKVHR